MKGNKKLSKPMLNALAFINELEKIMGRYGVPGERTVTAIFDRGLIEDADNGYGYTLTPAGRDALEEVESGE